MPQTILDLGRIVKQKHPEYGDLADDEVGRKVKGKFPGAYDDFMDAPQLPQAPLPAGLQPPHVGDHNGPVLGQPIMPGGSFIPTAVGMGAGKLGEYMGLPDWANTGIGIATGLAAESPRMMGGAVGAAKGAAESASHGFHFLNPVALAKGAYQGAQEGMSGKLWLGDAARGIRDWAFPKKPADISGRASTMHPDVAQYSQGAHPVQPPVEVGGAHVPSLTLPEFGPDGWPLPGPAEMQQKLSALPETAGPTAASPGANARFSMDQYGPAPIKAEPVSKYRMTQPLTPTPVTPAAMPATSPILPDAVTPAGAPAASNGGYAFTHPTGSMADLRKQLFATGQEMELPGSPAKTRATQQIRDSSMDLFGKSVSNLEHGELFKLNEFLAKHKRLPTKADLDLLGAGN